MQRSYFIGHLDINLLRKKKCVCRTELTAICNQSEPLKYIFKNSLLKFKCKISIPGSKLLEHRLNNTFCPYRDLVDEAKNYLLLPQERPLMQGPRTRPRKPIRCGEVLFAGECFSKQILVLIPLIFLCHIWFQQSLLWVLFVWLLSCLSVGGWCSGDAISSVERYDPQTNEWRMVASMSKRRCGVGVSVLDDLLYAVGGHDGSSYLNSVERCCLKNTNSSIFITLLESNE